jgi:hypothetical protein
MATYPFETRTPPGLRLATASDSSIRFGLTYHIQGGKARKADEHGSGRSRGLCWVRQTEHRVGHLSRCRFRIRAPLAHTVGGGVQPRGDEQERTPPQQRSKG